MEINNLIEKKNNPKIQVKHSKFEYYSIDGYPCLTICCNKEITFSIPTKHYDNSILIDTLNLGKQVVGLKILEKIELAKHRTKMDIFFFEKQLFKKEEIKDLEKFYKKYKIYEYGEGGNTFDFVPFVINTNNPEVDAVKKDCLFFIDLTKWLYKYGLPYTPEEQDIYRHLHRDVFTLIHFLLEIKSIYMTFLDFQEGKKIKGFEVKSNGFFLFESPAKNYDLIPYVDSLTELIRFQLGLYISDEKGVGICKKCKKLFSGNAKKETCSDACRKAYSREKKKEMEKNGNN